MENPLELVGLLLVALLCAACAKTDISSGVVPNKMLKAFLGIAVVYDILYYGFVARELFGLFVIDLAVVSLVSLVLFYTHSFAGGDCKMAMVLASIFPAGCYLNIWGTNCTLVFALVLALVFGYVYLLLNSLRLLMEKKAIMSLDYVKHSLASFVQSYLAALTYISLVCCAATAAGLLSSPFGVWIIRFACVAIALSMNRVDFLKRWACFVPVAVAVLVFSCATSLVPVSLRLDNILRVFILFLCQMTIKTTIYERIDVDDLKNGMILTTISSMLMQSSITPGLPKISTEDLRSRLTDDEVVNVRLWAKATKTTSLTVVKKVPFAALMGAGFMAYAVMGVLRWL